MSNQQSKHEPSSHDGSPSGPEPNGEQGSEFFGRTARSELPVDRSELRAEVQKKYAEVAEKPHADFHFHTGHTIAERCRYDMAIVEQLPDQVVESFAGVANPFELRAIEPGERVVDLGSGAGFDSLLAARAVGQSTTLDSDAGTATVTEAEAGYVIGVDMTAEMLIKARANAELVGADNVEFRDGYLEDIPVADGWADVVISNGVINLCPDKAAAMAEIDRVLRPGGWLQFADIANGAEVPEEAQRHIDLWTG